jgi:uncharacterized membrane protein
MITAKPKFTQLSTLLFSDKKLLFSAAVLVIFYAVGLWGLLFSGDPEYYQNLTPMNLLLTAFLLFLNHKNFNPSFWLFGLLTFTAGFLAEVLGVHTGLLFGNYAYGKALGFKLWNVPLLIGLNWVILVYCIGSFTHRKFQNKLVAALAATALMVALDYLIEPVAMQYDFWSWQNNTVPLKNYLGWFGLAFLLQLFFQLSGTNKNNPLAGWVFAVMATFFLVLNMY